MLLVDFNSFLSRIFCQNREDIVYKQALNGRGNLDDSELITETDQNGYEILCRFDMKFFISNPRIFFPHIL